MRGSCLNSNPRGRDTASSGTSHCGKFSFDQTFTVDFSGTPLPQRFIIIRLHVWRDGYG
jgi:hypothetical protein